MGFYSDCVLPRLLNLAMGSKALAAHRRRPVPLTAGRVLKVEIGLGLSLPFHSSVIYARFGPCSAAAVQACSDTDVQPKPPGQGQGQGQEKADLARLEDTDSDPRLVGCADKPQNAHALSGGLTRGLPALSWNLALAADGMAGLPASPAAWA